MPQVTFAVGQRWISNTEADLGLGTVERYESRRVHLFFPAAEDVRTYAVDNAPISRVIYAVGDELTTDAGAAFSVVRIENQDGCYLYVGIDDDGREVAVHESLLNSFVRFARPQDRLFAGQIDSNARFLLRMDTRALSARHLSSPALGLLGARVQLLPHQLYIASEVARRHKPRVLLADEVGLGKTIESGLIVHHRLLSGTASRVLVVVPENLVHQWLVEMLRRFALGFTVLDEERCEELIESGQENPFETTQLAIVALDLLTEKPERLAQAVAAGWDIVVADEAHHLQWHDGVASPGYQAIEALGRGSPGLLLLTATPEQLGVEGHFARLRLIDPDKYHDLGAFIEAEGAYTELGEKVEVLASAELPMAPADLERFADLLPAELLPELESADPKVAAAAREQALDCLLDRHGTGRVLFRNTRAAIGGFPGRIYLPHPLEGAPGYYQALADAPGESAPREFLTPERVLGEGWTEFDPRLGWLVELLGSNRGEKALVICAHAATARELEEYLRTRGGVRSAVFHEGMSLVARDRAAAYFAEEEDESAQVLVASEIGSEGRNFQAAQHLVLFDLPVNPDLLEQRIGRLDRIGQRHEIKIHVPYYQRSPQAVLTRWYHEGLAMFEAPSPAANGVMDAFAERLAPYLDNPGGEHESAAGLDELLGEARSETERLTQLLHDGRERLLEANSYRPTRAREVVSAVTAATYELELMDYMERVFDQFGVDQERHSQQAVVLKPSDHMVFEQFPGLPEDGMVATFSRTQALAREDMAFLTWEHPMVLGAIDLVLHGEIGNTAVSTLKLGSVKAGVLLLEALFVLDCPAPTHLQLRRYLSDGIVRVLVDANGADLSGVLSGKQFGQLARRLPVGTAQQIVRETRGEVTALIARAEELADAQTESLVAAAQARAESMLREELGRLQALAAVNPDIDPAEIVHLETLLAETTRHLRQGQLVLDAVRLAVTV